MTECKAYSRARPFFVRRQPFFPYFDAEKGSSQNIYIYTVLSDAKIAFELLKN